MKLCITNHFETQLRGSLYIGVLNARRPLIRPGSLSEKSLAFICTKDGFFEQATPAAELCSSSKLDFTTQFCFFEDLKQNYIYVLLAFPIIHAACGSLKDNIYMPICQLEFLQVRSCLI
jgi:hypothetical protein